MQPNAKSRSGRGEDIAGGATSSEYQLYCVGTVLFQYTFALILILILWGWRGCTHTWKVGAATVHMVGFASVASATSATP